MLYDDIPTLDEFPIMVLIIQYVLKTDLNVVHETEPCLT
jgi:hypothetical protein